MSARRLALAVLALQVLVLAPEHEAAGAVDGVLYSPITGHWYKHYDEVVSWQTARGKAAALGGYLAVVTSSTENQWIVSAFNRSRPSWLGATDEASESVWRWVSGESWSYVNWDSGQPSNGGGKGEHYLELQISGMWNDAPPTDPDGYIVEWNKDPNGPGPDPKPEPDPPPRIDLSIPAMSCSPASPSPGGTLTVEFTVVNGGEEDAGAFAVRFTLVGHREEKDAPPLGELRLSGLERSRSIAKSLEVSIPASILPGRYLPRLTAVPLDGSEDTNVKDNSRDGDHPFEIEHPPLPLDLGNKLRGELGPWGRQRLLVTVVPGLRGRLKAKIRKAGGAKWLARDGDTSPIARAEGKKALNHRLEGGDEDVLVLGVESESPDPVSFTASLKGSVRLEGELDVVPEGVDLMIPGYPGRRASAAVEGRDGLVPVLDLGALGAPHLVKATKRGAKVKNLWLRGGGPWTLRLSCAEGAAGLCDWSIRVK